MTSPASDTPAPPRKPRRRLLWTSLIIVVLLLIMATLALLVGNKKKAIQAQRASDLGKNATAINVVLYELTPHTLHDRLSLPATVAPWVDLAVTAQVGETIIEKAVQEGDLVEKGDLLAVVDDRKYENAHNSAAASLKSALASQKRLRNLHQRNLASQADLDTIEATVENARAAVRNAALDLERCRILAPISGMINNVFFETGQVITPGQAVVRILKIDPVKITVGIPESDVTAVRRLETFQVFIDALDKATFVGRKKFLSRSTRTNARLYDLEILVDNPDHQILPDMFARVNINKKTVPGAMVAPLFALIPTDSGHSVYVEKDGRVHLKPVTIGIQDNFLVEITSGLNFGDRIVVVGQKRITDGQMVNIVRTIKDPRQAQL